MTGTTPAPSARPAVELADDVGTRRGVLFSHSLASIIALHRNDLTAAEDAAAAAEREFAETGRQSGLEYWVLLARALLLEATGRPEAACETLWSAWRQGAEVGNLSYNADLGPDLVRLSLATGQPGQAAEVSAGVQALAAAQPRRGPAGGRCPAVPGAGRRRPRTLLQAVAAHRRGPRPLELARACEDAAATLPGPARPAEAAPLVRGGPGAVRAAGGVARRRQGRGRAPGRRSPPWPPGTEGPAQERLGEPHPDRGEGRGAGRRGVVEPRDRGRMFVSRHTVHTHVSHILAKLGLGSRVELAAAAARRRP